MKNNGLLWRLFASYLFMILLFLLALAWMARREIRELDYTLAGENLEVMSRLFFDAAYRTSSLNSPDKLDKLSRDTALIHKARITVLDGGGKVLADSERQAAYMENHADRLEIRQALSGKTGMAIRHSQTLDRDMLYIAVPFELSPGQILIVRTSAPLTALDIFLKNPLKKIVFVAFFLAVLSSGVSFFVYRRISRPLTMLKTGVEAVARGDFRVSVPVHEAPEFGGLAVSVNRMAAELDRRMKTIERKNAELEALLAGMNGGVLAVDGEERIVFHNPEALELLNIGNAEVKGRFIQEAVRIAELHDVIRRTMETGERMETEITILSPTERFIQVKSATLPDEAGNKKGALIVLNDLTRIYHLEKIRREFAANASHELRTPVTSIRGFAETLLSHENIPPEKRKRYMEIILRQSLRLEGLIDDLLTLTRLENRSVEPLETIEQPLLALVEPTIETFIPQAAEKNVQIELTCPEKLRARVNSALIERALSNLVDNALKYGVSNGQVNVEVKETASEIGIYVRDQGPGISREHLSRLFERFYRVDKARSVKLGGTGLGLAIVRHTALAHGGRVFVDSTPGQGSTFGIILPKHGKA